MAAAIIRQDKNGCDERWAVDFTDTIYEVTTQQSVTGSPHAVGLVTALTGFAILCSGIYMFYQYSKPKKLAP